MIIKNNFNAHDANPLENYHKIGKDTDSFEENIREKNFDNKIIQDVLKKDSEYQEEDLDSDDKWKFFR